MTLGRRKMRFEAKCLQELEQLAPDRRQAILNACTHDLNAPAWAKLPFRLGAALTCVAIAVMMLVLDQSFLRCMVVGVIAMFVGVGIGLPMMRAGHRRLLKRRVRSYMAEEAQPIARPDPKDASG